MNILEELATTAHGLPLSRLSERLGMPKTSLLSLLRALEAAGYVVNLEGLYRVGTAAMRLGSMIAAANPFPASLRHLLQDLGRLTGETCVLGTLTEDAREVVYVDMIDGVHSIRFAGSVGTRRPLHASALGKALLAFQDAAFVDAVLAAGRLHAHTRRTIVEPRALRRALDAIAAAGVSTTEGEMVEDVGGVAAPVVGSDGRVRVGVLVAAPVGRVTSQRAAFARHALAIGEQMSRALGYSGAYPPPVQRAAPAARRDAAARSRTVAVR